MADFADRIKLYRTMYGLSLEDLAKRLGTQKQVVHRYEKRQQIPKIDLVEEYATIMNVSVPWLIGYDNGGSERPDKVALCHVVDNLTDDQLRAIKALAETMLDFPPKNHGKAL